MRAPWTHQEEAFLRREIGAHTIDWLARKLGRPHGSVYAHASRIGALRDAYQGMESVSEAGRRLGMDNKTMLAVLRWAGAPLQSGKTPCTTRRPRRVRLYVETTDADEAVERYMRSETLAAASRRIGCTPETLRGYLGEAGMMPEGSRSGVPIRLDPAVYDRVFADGQRAAAAAMERGRARGLEARRAAARARESIRQAAKRCGTDQTTLRKALAHVGVATRRGRSAGLAPGQAEAALAAWRDLQGEPLRKAAKRLGVSVETLRAALLATGVRTQRSRRVHLAPGQADAALRAAGIAPRPARGESLRVAAARLRVSQKALREALAATGVVVRPGQSARIARGQAEAALATRPASRRTVREVLAALARLFALGAAARTQEAA